jgi:hypothetical protein
MVMMIARERGRQFASFSLLSLTRNWPDQLPYKFGPNTQLEQKAYFTCTYTQFIGHSVMNNSCLRVSPPKPNFACASPLLLFLSRTPPYLSSKPQIYRLRRHYSLYHLSRHNLLLLEHHLAPRKNSVYRVNYVGHLFFPTKSPQNIYIYNLERHISTLQERPTCSSGDCGGWVVTLFPVRMMMTVLLPALLNYCGKLAYLFHVFCVSRRMRAASAFFVCGAPETISKAIFSASWMQLYKLTYLS